jgi:hypothetical protein
MIMVTFDAAGAMKKIAAIRDRAKNPRAVMAAAGREGANQLKKHFREKNAKEPNKLGGKRENFWNKVGQSVQNPNISPDGRTISIAINDPRFAQKLFGGVITAKRVRNLSIPQTAEAYGRYPSTFQLETGITLFLVKTKKGVGLAARAANLGVTVHYILTPSVKQAPTPEALPKMDDVGRAMADRAQKVLDRQTQQS